MQWFRSRAKHGARLALLALAVQFVLSFGHFHWDAAQAAPAINSIATQSASADAVQPDAGQATLAADPAQPASRHPPGPHPGDYCAICAVMSLAGSVTLAEPPLLLLPQAYRLLYLTTDAEFSHLAPRHRDYQPRAPPAS